MHRAGGAGDATPRRLRSPRQIARLYRLHPRPEREGQDHRAPARPRRHRRRHRRDPLSDLSRRRLRAAPRQPEVDLRAVRARRHRPGAVMTKPRAFLELTETTEVATAWY